MSRHLPKLPARGSARWIQQYVKDGSADLSRSILEELGRPADVSLEWVSPLWEDGYAEYRDECFLERVGLDRLAEPLRQFWPRRGPQWDALAIGPAGEVYLVEAKANLREFVSPPTQATGRSLDRILDAIAETQSFMGVKQASQKIKDGIVVAERPLHTPDKWSNTFYQYTNRLAYLYFLREKAGVDACLACIYFVNEPDTGGPRSQAEWMSAIEVAERHLGIPARHPLRSYCAKVFINVAD